MGSPPPCVQTPQGFLAGEAADGGERLTSKDGRSTRCRPPSAQPLLLQYRPRTNLGSAASLVSALMALVPPTVLGTAGGSRGVAASCSVAVANAASTLPRRTSATGSVDEPMPVEDCVRSPGFRVVHDRRTTGVPSCIVDVCRVPALASANRRQTAAKVSCFGHCDNFDRAFVGSDTGRRTRSIPPRP